MTQQSAHEKVREIYFIDDDEEDALLFESALRSIDKSIRLVPFSNGKEALDFLATASIQPEMIILDINMPVMTGFECLEFLKASDVLRAIPVVILTTSKSPKDRETCLAMGAQRFLSKPNSYKELDLLIRDVLRAGFSTKPTS